MLISKKCLYVYQLWIAKVVYVIIIDVLVPTYISVVPHSHDLERYAAELKLVLSRIPSEISNRNDFIELIK